MLRCSYSLHIKCVHQPLPRHAVSRAVKRALTQRTQPRHVFLVRALDLSGNWAKDQENSDLNAYSDMLSLLGLSGIRKIGALKLINALTITHCAEEPQFSVKYVVSKVQFLKSVEQFALGHSVKMPRRDGEQGVQTGTLTQNSSQVQTVVTWDKPNPGATSILAH